MITIEIEESESFDGTNNAFYYSPLEYVSFEHSLKAISDWETVYKIPFLSSQLDESQIDSYYALMCLNPSFDTSRLTDKNRLELAEYIKDSSTATIIQNGDKNNGRGRVTTSEVVYAMMVLANIPFECDRWNFNRLMTLMGVISHMQSPPKKMSRNEVMQQNVQLNEQRKKQHNTKG